MCIDHSGIMVKTPPYQKWGKCGHFMSQFDSHPCTHGTNVNQCASSSTLSDKQWTHLCESFAKKSSNHNSTGSQNDNVEPELKDEPVFTGEKLSQVDDTLLVLEPEQSGNQLQASVFSLTSHLQLLSQWRIFRQTPDQYCNLLPFQLFSGAGSSPFRASYYPNGTNTQQTIYSW